MGSKCFHALDSLYSVKLCLFTYRHLIRNHQNRRSLDAELLQSMELDRGGAGDDGVKMTNDMNMVDDGIFSKHTDNDSCRDSEEELECEIKLQQTSGGGDVLTELDRKIQEATKLLQRNCNCMNGRCSRLTVRKIGEGKYNIAGRNVFVRVSNDVLFHKKSVHLYTFESRDGEVRCVENGCISIKTYIQSLLHTFL